MHLLKLLRTVPARQRSSLQYFIVSVLHRTVTVPIDNRGKNLTRNSHTPREGITGIAGRAGAYGRVFNHVTDSIGSTRTWARVLAFFIHARKVSRTFRIDGAFWSAVWSTSDVVR